MIRILNFVLVMAIVYFAVPVALPGADITLKQAAAITLLAFIWRALLTPEPPSLVLINREEDE